MLEIRLHTLLLVIAGTICLIALPFVARSLVGRPLPVHAASQSLPTPTPVPIQGLSERARELAASLVLTPTQETLPTPLPPVISATVRTDGRPLNLRRGPGLTYPVLGSAQRTAPLGLRTQLFVEHLSQCVATNTLREVSIRRINADVLGRRFQQYVIDHFRRAYIAVGFDGQMLLNYFLHRHSHVLGLQFLVHYYS